MKIEIPRDQFVKSLSRVVRVIEARQTIPVLGNVWLSGTGAELSMRATDLDLEAADTISATIEEAGAVTVPAGMLNSIVQRLPAGSVVSMDTTGTLLDLRCGKGRFKLPTLPAEDFPTSPMTETNVKFSVPQGVIRGMIGRIQFAMSDEETRFYLNGVFAHIFGDKLRFVATDGHRLAKVETIVPEGAVGMKDIIIPKKTVNEIMRLLDTSDYPVQFEIGEYKLRLRVGNYTLTSKLIDSTYPDYERVIPKGHDKEMETDLETLVAAVERVAAVQERGRPITLAFEADALKLSVDNRDLGSSVDEIDCSYQSDPLTIGFNSKYLLDVLKNIGDADVVGNFGAPGEAGLFHPKSDPTALYVCMPMAVK